MPIFVLINMLLILISKESSNYTNYRIIIFLLGFFTIIFSETTIRFVENTFAQNIKIIILPFIISIILYQFFYKKLYFKINKK